MAGKRTWIGVIAALAAASGGCGGGGPTGGLIGVWRAGFNDPTFGPGAVELILMGNGQFQQQTFYQAGSLVTIFGTYRVFPAEGLLRLDILRGEPAQACGPLGCTPIIYPAGESHAYTLLDSNTLLLQNINCPAGAGGACQLAYQRAV